MSTAKTVPVWDLEPDTRLRPLDGNASADVCVIGAGISGLSVALSCLQSRRSVIVIDRDGVGQGETQRTSAHLSSALDDRYATLQRTHGERGARLAADSHRTAIAQIENWLHEYRIEAGFKRVDGWLFPEPGSPADLLERDYEAALRVGVAVERAPGGAPGFEALGAALRFREQARIEPAQYMRGLADAVRSCGGNIYRGEAVDIDAGGFPRVHLKDGREIKASAVVVATNVPFHRRVVMHTKQAAYRTYVIAGTVPAGRVPDALFWDTGDPYHYIRLLRRDGEDLLLVGGEDRKTGQEEGQFPFVELAKWIRRFVPEFGELRNAWSGQVLEPVDGMAFIGADPGHRNVFVVTGDSGNGLTHGTLAGPLLCDLIAGNDHPWRELYEPGRKRLNGAWLEENANVGAQYRDWVTAGDVQSSEQIRPGVGAVVRHGLHRLALYRADNGTLHAYSARCPHLGCSVRWNGIERSFDCPCHGSRFDAATGRPLNGPAITPLERVNEEDGKKAAAA